MNNTRSPAPGLFNIGNARKNMMSNVGNVFTNAANSVGNVFTNAANTVSNVANTTTNVVSKSPNSIRMILIIVFAIVLIVFAIFWKQINDGLKTFYHKIRQMFGATPEPSPDTSDEEKITEKPEAPQDDMIHEKNMVEKILPGRQEVFNISKNNYTYYDAEPLCKALGAELATYEQVKQAYAGGADWCNYGWTKGQMAVYPTQTDTWEQLQQGPEDQRNACGRPGVNGGFFDNPELRFGVNCYGVKPQQKDHDATAITSGEGAPLSPGALEFEKKTAKYRGEANSIGILPFSKSTWSA
jgi:hypothetical protein